MAPHGGRAEIRPVRPEEYEETGRVIVAAFEALSGGERLSDGYARELSDVARRASEADVLVAVDGRVLGSATFVRGSSSPWAELLLEDEAGIRMLAVLPEAQGNGVGRALLDACIERARELGRAAVFLHTTPWMTAAQHMYDAAGFLRVAERDWLPVPEVPLLAYRLELS